MRYFFAAILIGLTSSVPGHGRGWGVGPAASAGTPSLSVHFQPKLFTAYHFIGHYLDAQTAGASFDLQRFYYPDSLAPYKLAIYGGIGFKGVASRAADAEEAFFLSVPVGTQWQPKEFPVQMFFDMATLVGKLPDTGIDLEARAGMRACF